MLYVWYRMFVYLLYVCRFIVGLLFFIFGLSSVYSHCICIKPHRDETRTLCKLFSVIYFTFVLTNRP